MRRADIAMYLAKQARMGCAVYAPGHDRHSVEGLRLSLDLRRAIVDGELVLHYQPKLDLGAGRVAGSRRWLAGCTRRSASCHPTASSPRRTGRADPRPHELGAADGRRAVCRVAGEGVDVAWR